MFVGLLVDEPLINADEVMEWRLVDSGRKLRAMDWHGPSFTPWLGACSAPQV